MRRPSDSRMSRRGIRFTPIVAILLAILLAGYGYYIYTNQTNEIVQATVNLDKCHGNRKVLKEQLQVVYKHTAKLEEALRKEKDDHHVTKQEYIHRVKEFELNITKSKHEAMNRFNALDTNFKMLKANNDELNENHVALQQQYMRLSSDHKSITEAAKKEYEALKSAKETESYTLQNRIQDLFNTKVNYQEQAKANKDYYEKAVLDLKKATDLAKEYMERIKLYEKELAKYKADLVSCKVSSRKVNATENWKNEKKVTDGLMELKEEHPAEEMLEEVHEVDVKKTNPVETKTVNKTTSLGSSIKSVNNQNSLEDKIKFEEEDSENLGRYHLVRESLKPDVQLMTSPNDIMRDDKEEKLKGDPGTNMNPENVEVLDLEKEADFNDETKIKVQVEKLVEKPTNISKEANNLNLQDTNSHGNQTTSSIKKEKFSLGDLLRKSHDSENTVDANVDDSVEHEVTKSRFNTLVGVHENSTNVRRDEGSEKVKGVPMHSPISKEKKEELVEIPSHPEENPSQHDKDLNNNGNIPLAAPVKDQLTSEDQEFASLHPKQELREYSKDDDINERERAPLKPPMKRDDIDSHGVEKLLERNQNDDHRMQLNSPSGKIEEINAPVRGNTNGKLGEGEPAVKSIKSKETEDEDGDENELKVEEHTDNENEDDSDTNDHDNQRNSETEEEEANDLLEADEERKPVKINSNLNERLDVKKVTLEDDEKGDQNLDQNGVHQLSKNNEEEKNNEVEENIGDEIDREEDNN